MRRRVRVAGPAAVVLVAVVVVVCVVWTARASVVLGGDPLDDEGREENCNKLGV